MKKILFTAVAALLLATASCSDEQTFNEGQGRVVLTTKVSTDMAVISRSLEEDYAASTMIWISDSRGLIRRYNSLSELPVEPLVLRSGSYVAEAWCGDSVPASFEKRWFKAEVPFTVTDGGTTNVPLTLKVANVAVSVKYDENISEVLRNCKMTVGHTYGSLVYEGETAAQRGYFMLPQASRTLNYKLEAEQLNGTPFEVSGTIENTVAATEYVLHVVYTPESSEFGAGFFTITVDNRPIPVQNEDVEITAPPRITGYGFQLSEPIMSVQGQMDRVVLHIASASKLTSVLLKSDALTPVIGGDDVELLSMHSSVRAAMTAAGINFNDDYYNAADDNSVLQLNFEETFVNALQNGRYTFDITAVDREGRTGRGTLTINITNAPVTAVSFNEMDVYTNRAAVSATVLNTEFTEYGFKYRKAGGAWTTVAVTPNDGVIATQLTGLEAGTAYECVAYADGYMSEAVTVTTEAAAQLPNSSFEDWDTSSKTYLICAPGAEMYWDSGNHGATTMGSSITTPDNTLKHSGTYSAKLYSKFIGVGSIGKFAAGNLFAGKYLATEGTDGVLGWGRPFASRPSALKIWVKYVPQPADSKGGKADYIPTGSLDKGMIYAALLDDSTMDYNGDKWPVVIKTATGNRQLFDKNASKVIAYGEHKFESATEGEGMVQITIPFDYKRTDIKPSNIVLVCSASMYGDYFSGGEGSTMWVDDIELVYE